ncbi:META domain-containing protein [Streptomyces tropicalis]|uniref:META domain-containing protein n=1 Tax=Streptomyces tropicalis TaxID=3034234 RepID=A0ABT6A6B6_9ACTN|nr:META domain-containing protein [Streptomyces tropicalis]MDF3300194.1 META domain-containing protein [Streptomyces tropicalis]
MVGHLLAAVITLAACGAPRMGTDGRESGHAGPATAWSPPKGPGGAGGLLVGARWLGQWITVGGRTTAAPAHAGAWVDFGHDGTVAGSYGCTSFRRTTHVTAGTLTLGAPVAQPTAGIRCAAKNRAFEEEFRTIFSGRLTITRRVDDLTIDLKNSRGDYLALKLLWPKGLFGRRWQVDHLGVADTIHPLAAGRAVYFVFHRDGTVTGNLGCNDFTGRATFSGDLFTLYRLTPTTHRTCSKDVMRDERIMLSPTTDPRSTRFSAMTDSWECDHDPTQGFPEFGYGFQALDR